MKIDRKKVIGAFNDYVAEFDETDEMIRLKKLHTVNVASICEEIGKSLKLDDFEVDLCWFIGMMHDMARFIQYSAFGTFVDAKSVDHAELGCQLLFEEKLLDTFIDYSDEDKIILDFIENAIRYHSLYKLPEGLDETQRMYCNIIRDADKIDIFRVACEEPVESVYCYTEDELLNATISPEVMKAFYEHHAIRRDLRHTPLDFKVGFLALSFELVYERSRQIALEQGYLLRIIHENYRDKTTAHQLEEMKKEVKNNLL